MPEQISVHIIDDDEAMRDSLQFLLQSAKLTVRCYDTAKSFLDELNVGESDCIITDLRMPEIDGIELVRLLRERSINLPVIVITGHGDIALAVEAMKCGAIDFIEKPFRDDRILSAIRAGLEVGKRSGARETERLAVVERLASLSQRERQVLDGLVAGAANKAIAFDLKISPRTVEIYRANVMTKMGAKSLSDLVRMALLVGSS